MNRPENSSRFNVPQKVEILLDPKDGYRTVLINGTPIDNIAGIGVQTLDDDVGETMVTLKIRACSAFFSMALDGVR